MERKKFISIPEYDTIDDRRSPESDSCSQWKTSALVATSVFLLACGSSSSDSDSVNESQPEQQSQVVVATQTATLFESGSEPRSELTVSNDTSRMLTVNAKVDETLSMSGNESTDTVSATYDVLVDLSVGSESVSLQLTPILKSYSAGEFDPTDTLSGRWKLSYNLRGELVDFEESSDTSIVRHNTLGVFDLPDLLLPVPADAIGVGARWNYESQSPQGPVIRTFQVTALNDSTITVEENASIAPNSQFSGFQRTASRTSTYDTSSLLLVSMQASISTGFESMVNVNQQSEQLTSALASSFSVSEVQQ